MSKDKSAKPAIFTLHGYIKAQIAKAIGFHERTLPDMTWKSIPFRYERSAPPPFLFPFTPTCGICT